MLLIFLIFQTPHIQNAKPERNIYYYVPSSFIPYISSTNAYSVPANYKVNKGDILLFVFYGTFNQIYMQQVTNSGEIWIITSPTSIKSFSLSSPFETEPSSEIKGPNLGFFKVEGKTLKEIEREISEELKKKFAGITLRVYLAELGEIEVQVVGNVNNPGTLRLRRLSRVYDALKSAGVKNEIKKVVLYRENKKDTIYIWKYLKEGDMQQNPYLEDKDIIIVP